MERRCAGAVVATGLGGGEMGEALINDRELAARAPLQGRLDARDEAQRAATHATVFAATVVYFLTAVDTRTHDCAR